MLVVDLAFNMCLQEYGSGRLHKKHSTFFAAMMRELGLETREEHYFDLVPWQSLAAMNHNFLLTERRRHYLRYAGGLTFFEVKAGILSMPLFVRLPLHVLVPCFACEPFSGLSNPVACLLPIRSDS